MRRSIILVGLVLIWGQALWGQVPPDTGKASIPGREDYFLDPATQKLFIDVHIWGEVTKPGVYRVPLGTNVLELISQAGGFTEYSNLSRVKLTQRGPSGSSRLATVDLARYMNAKGGPPIPVLGPGDLVVVPRNVRYAWETSIKLIGDIVVIANLFYLISYIKH